MIIFGSLAAHELAHLLAARLAGLEVYEITLTPLGGIARLDSALEADPQSEIGVALAGPFQSCFLAILGMLASMGSGWDPALLMFFVQVNASLAFFNLLPALPLDGGRAFRGFVAQAYGYKAATQWLLWIGRGIGIVMTLVGVAALVTGRTYWTAVIGGPYLVWLAGSEQRMGRYRSFEQLLRKRRRLAQRRVMPAASIVALADTRLDRLLMYLAVRRYHLVLVVDDEMRPLATMGESQLWEAFKQHGPMVTLAALLRPEAPPFSSNSSLKLAQRGTMARVAAAGAMGESRTFDDQRDIGNR